jgi:hypothetical protein
VTKVAAMAKAREGAGCGLAVVKAVVQGQNGGGGARGGGGRGGGQGAILHKHDALI